jgi:hypothetical protein
MALGVSEGSVTKTAKGMMFDGVMAAGSSGNTLPPGMVPWVKGQSGNPSGRPKLARPPSVALAELNDTPGADTDEMIENYRAKRGDKFCAADAKAIAAFRRDMADAAYGVAAFDSSTNRLEGKVEQSIHARTDATLTINIIDRDVQLALLRQGREDAIDVEIVKSDE